MNIDILNEVPQFPGGPWANHLIYGTILGIAIFGGLMIFRMDHDTAMIYANVLTLFVSASKKMYDYNDRGPSQGETSGACIGKTFVTCFGIFAISIFS